METPMTEPELIDEIIKFNNDANVQRLQNLYNNPTFLDILAIGRREPSHSAFLAWLFDTAANHGLGATPILQLLELIVRCSHEQHKEKEMVGVLRNAILSRSIAIYNTVVSTEYNVKTQTAKGRADIVIDVRVGIPDPNISKLRVVIENKIYSKEHSCQTNTYFEYFDKEKQSGEYILYIYLTPPLMQDKASCDNFVHITYQDLLNNVFEPILLLPDLSERTRFILTEYINCLSIPVEEFQGNNIKRTTIMAISENERILLKAFWEKNQQLIIAAANAISTDPNSEPEARVAAENVVEMSKKDGTKYSVNGKGSHGKWPTVKRFVECYLERHPNLSIDELKKIFPDSLQGAGLGVIRSTKDVINDYSRYKESQHPNTKETYYICNQWYKNKDRDNFQDFRKYVEEHIPEIKITQI